MKKLGRVLKTLKPGQPGTKRWQEFYGGRLVTVRYRGDAKRRVRLTTVELVVEEKFWDPVAFKNYKSAMSNTRHSG